MTIERTNMERKLINLDIPELKRNSVFFDPEKISRVKLGCYNVGQSPTKEHKDCIEILMDNGDKERLMFANKVNDFGKYLEYKDAEQVLLRVLEIIENIIEYRNTPVQTFDVDWTKWPLQGNEFGPTCEGNSSNTVEVTWGKTEINSDLEEESNNGEC